MSDIVARAKAALEGVTEAPWHHRTAPSADSVETHAEWLANTLVSDGQSELHVLIADSPEPKFAYIVPAVTGDGPTSERNAEFIAAARTIVPALVAEVERLREGLARIENFSRLQALSDRVRTGPAAAGYHSEERSWLDLLAIIERAQGGDS